MPEPAVTAGPPAEGGRILLVDDEPALLRTLLLALRRTPWTLVTAGGATEALRRLEAEPFDAVVSDHRMPEMTGVEFLRIVKSRWPDTQRVMLTGQADRGALQEAINRSEIFRFISKPWDDDDLLATLVTAVDASRLARENRRLLRLTLQKNDELAALNASLEAKVAERTALLTLAKREWEATFDILATPVAVIDGASRIRRANQAWSAQATTGARLLEGLPNLWSGQGGPITFERRWEQRVLVVTAFPWPGAASVDDLVAVVTYQDVTDARRRADWRLQTERLAAVGRLAGGVAHEINNPLASVLAFAQILLSTPRPPDDVEALKLIEEGALRCKRAIETLMRFAGTPGESSRRPVALQQITADTLTLFRSELARKAGAELTLDPVAPQPTLLADGHALGQALMDLLHHRLRALPVTGGTLSLATVQEGGMVGWTVVDNAPALTPEQIAELSDPELTNPEGLGLAFRVAHEHGGRVDVTPLGDRGNRFSLLVGNLATDPLPP